MNVCDLAKFLLRAFSVKWFGKRGYKSSAFFPLYYRLTIERLRSCEISVKGFLCEVVWEEGYKV